MIKLADKIYIGNSSDEQYIDLVEFKIDGLLNVAKDLRGKYRWTTDIERAQVGLIDGPGNILSSYSAAVLVLYTLTDRCEGILVFDHDGGRSLAIVVMYLSLRNGKTSSHPTILNHWAPWDVIFKEVCGHAVYSQSERKDDTGLTKIPKVHEAHKEAYDVMPFSLLESLI